MLSYAPSIDIMKAKAAPAYAMMTAFPTLTEPFLYEYKFVISMLKKYPHREFMIVYAYPMYVELTIYILKQILNYKIILK